MTRKRKENCNTNDNNNNNKKLTRLLLPSTKMFAEVFPAPVRIGGARIASRKVLFSAARSSTLHQVVIWKDVVNIENRNICLGLASLNKLADALIDQVANGEEGEGLTMGVAWSSIGAKVFYTDFQWGVKNWKLGEALLDLETLMSTSEIKKLTHCLGPLSTWTPLRMNSSDFKIYYSSLYCSLSVSKLIWTSCTCGYCFGNVCSSQNVCNSIL